MVVKKIKIETNMVEKKIKIVTDAEIDIHGITLLSIDEYEKAKEDIPVIDDWWWLRSPGFTPFCAGPTMAAMCVFGYGEDGNVVNVVDDGSLVSNELGVRPALLIDWKYPVLHVRDKILVAGYIWTIIPGRFALCDTCIGDHCFREDCKAKHANDYKNSDIKEFIKSWWAEKTKTA